MNIFQNGSLLLDFSITLHICTARGLVFYMCMFWKLCVMSYTETTPSLVRSLILAHLLDCLVPLIRCWYKSTCFTGTEVQILTQTRNVCGTVYSESIQLRQKQQHSLAGQCTTHTRNCTSIQNTCHKVECSNWMFKRHSLQKKKYPKMKRQYNHMFYFLWIAVVYHQICDDSIHCFYCIGWLHGRSKVLQCDCCFYFYFFYFAFRADTMTISMEKCHSTSSWSTSKDN